MHIGEIESYNKVNYAASQKEALETAMNSKVMLLTVVQVQVKRLLSKGLLNFMQKFMVYP